MCKLPIFLTLTIYLAKEIEGYTHPYQQHNRHPPYQTQRHPPQHQQRPPPPPPPPQPQHAQQRHPAQQTHHSNRANYQQPQKPPHQASNSVSSFDPSRRPNPPAHYPSHPHPVQPHSQPPQQQCDIPPDLWCDSAQSAQTCGVQRQCESLKRHHRPLKISLVYEALCPYCQKFIANQLGTIVNQFRGQFELELIPWGNARILRDGTFACDHGLKECEANRLQSCVIEVLGVQQALPFIVCFERALTNAPVDGAIHQCMAFVRNQYRQIRHCYDSERGVQLQRQAAHRTMTTRPNAIVEVPYLLINDYTPDTDTNNLNVMMLPQLLQKWIKLYRK